MRILVVSDTHGDYRKLFEIIKYQYSAEVILHLGDGDAEFEQIKRLHPDRMFVGVRGNCDYSSNVPDAQELVFNNKKIFMTHGHKYSAKLGFSSITAKARSVDANILLFGHTHYPFCEYQYGLYIMNPGSLRYTSTYGLIDIEKNGIVTNIVKIDSTDGLTNMVNTARV